MTSYLFWRLCLPLLDTTPLLNRTDYNNYVVCAAMLYTVTLHRGETLQLLTLLHSRFPEKCDVATTQNGTRSW